MRSRSGWRRKNLPQQTSTMKSVRAVIMGKDGVGKSGEKSLAECLVSREIFYTHSKWNISVVQVGGLGALRI